jgi:hypothetical protein
MMSGASVSLELQKAVKLLAFILVSYVGRPHSHMTTFVGTEEDTRSLLVRNWKRTCF